MLAFNKKSKIYLFTRYFFIAYLTFILKYMKKAIYKETY